MKTKLLIIIGILIAFTITFFVLGPSQGHIAEYFLTEEQFQDMVLGDNPHVVDSKNTENPNECWYQEDDGSMVPCKTDDWMVPCKTDRETIDLDPDLSPCYIPLKIFPKDTSTEISPEDKIIKLLNSSCNDFTASSLVA